MNLYFIRIIEIVAGNVIKVNVNLYSTLQNGRFKQADVALHNGANTNDLLNAVGVSPSDVGILVVNRKDATLSQKLVEGDRVTIIPPIGGG